MNTTNATTVFATSHHQFSTGHPRRATTSFHGGTPVYALQESAFIVLMVGAFLSVVGCLVIILTYTCSKTLQSKIVLRQVFFQSVATLVHSLGFFLSFGQADTATGQALPNSLFYCNIQGVLLTTSALAGFVYNFYIAFDLLSFVGYTPQVKKHRLLYQLMVWPVTLLIGIICFLAGFITYAGGFCWVAEEPLWARWVTFYVPLYAILGFCTFAIVAMPHKLRKMKLLENNRRIVNTAAAYNAIFLVCWVPASVYVNSTCLLSTHYLWIQLLAR